MSYLDLARDLVKRLESCRLTGYADSRGTPTDGYGHTGPEVRVGRAITQEVADHNLEVDLATAEAKLHEVLTPASWLTLTDHEKATLLSFVFNLGSNHDWTIWADVNDGRLNDVPVQLRRFVNVHLPDGQLEKVQGLVNRREAEVVYWNTADVAAAAAVLTAAPPTADAGAVRDLPTPPTPLPPQPLAKVSLAAKIVTAGGAALAAGAQQLGGTADKINQIVAPHADQSHIFATASTILVGVVVISAVVGLFIHGAQAQARKV